MALVNKKRTRRSPYDKIARQALEALRQELAPLREISAAQQKLLLQNEKILEYLRQLWDHSNQRAAQESTCPATVYPSENEPPQIRPDGNDLPE